MHAAAMMTEERDERLFGGSLIQETFGGDLRLDAGSKHRVQRHGFLFWSASGNAGTKNIV